MINDNVLRIFFIALFGATGSILTGLLYAGSSIFVQQNPDFQFVVFGIICSIFFGVMSFYNLKTQLLTGVTVLLINLLLFSGSFISFPLLLRDLFFISSAFISVKIYFYFINRNPGKMFFFRSFTLALFYGAVNALLGCVLFFINTKGAVPTYEFVHLVGNYGVLTGLGCGLGFDLYLRNEKIFAKPFTNKK
jgi:hypothetical protein